MTIENIDVSEAVERIKSLLKEEKTLSPAFKASVELLILVVSLLTNRLGRNSRNSSIPPSQDPNRVRKRKARGDVLKRKPGGQKNHEGSTLTRTETPDAIEEIIIDHWHRGGGAKTFCRIRGFLSTCRKNNVSPTEALRDLFQGKFPAFMM